MGGRTSCCCATAGNANARAGRRKAADGRMAKLRTEKEGCHSIVERRPVCPEFDDGLRVAGRRRMLVACNVRTQSVQLPQVQRNRLNGNQGNRYFPRRGGESAAGPWPKSLKSLADSYKVTALPKKYF